jgi:hypothetical protein
MARNVPYTAKSPRPGSCDDDDSDKNKRSRDKWSSMICNVSCRAWRSSVMLCFSGCMYYFEASKKVMVRIRKTWAIIYDERFTLEAAKYMALGGAKTRRKESVPAAW